MQYVYLIQHDVTKELYFGCTSDLVKRLKQHNAGVGSKFTSRAREGKWSYVYVELYKSKLDALEREKKLKKHAKGKHELLKRLKHSVA